MLLRNQGCDDRRKRDKSEIQWPDAQDASQVKSAQIQSACGSPLAQQQAGNQIGAQRKEQIHSVSARAKHWDEQAAQPMRISSGVVEVQGARSSMENKHAQKREEPQDIKLRPVKTFHAPAMPKASCR